MSATEYREPLEPDYYSDEWDDFCSDDINRAFAFECLPLCPECGNVNDDNPDDDLCATCADWIVR